MARWILFLAAAFFGAAFVEGNWHRRGEDSRGPRHHNRDLLVSWRLLRRATSAPDQWFYPACMIIVGAHYLPFSFLYRMRHFLPLGALMLAAGALTALYLPALATMGALLTSLLLVALAFIGRNLVSSREASPRPAASPCSGPHRRIRARVAD